MRWFGWFRRRKDAVSPKKMDPEAFRLLVDSYEAWLRVPKVSWGEWFDLDADAKAALIAAAKRIDTERALIAAKAASGRRGYLDVLSEIDGGDAKLIDALMQTLDEYEARKAREVPRP